MRLFSRLFVALTIVLLAGMASAQGLTGSLIGTITDSQGGVLPGVTVRASSTVLIGGPAIAITNQKGRFNFLVLPPGRYDITIELSGFATYREPRIEIGAGGTVERLVVMQLAGVA